MALVVRRQRHARLGRVGFGLATLVGMEPRPPDTTSGGPKVPDILEEDSDPYMAVSEKHDGTFAAFDRPNPLQDLAMGPMLR